MKNLKTLSLLALGLYFLIPADTLAVKKRNLQEIFSDSDDEIVEEVFPFDEDESECFVKSMKLLTQGQTVTLPNNNKTQKVINDIKKVAPIMKYKIILIYSKKNDYISIIFGE
jgi:hypothetical protein